MKKYIILTVLACMIVVNIPSNTAYSAPEQTKYTPKQSIYLSALQWCESQGNIKALVFDTNEKYSYGLFQFQLSTFLHYGKKYDILQQDITDEKALKLIYDPELQKQIAYEMLNDDLAYHWANCAKKIGGKFPKE